MGRERGMAEGYESGSEPCRTSRFVVPWRDPAGHEGHVPVELRPAAPGRNALQRNRWDADGLGSGSPQSS